jgi:hypothetical protein
MATHPFLSDEWLVRARAIRAESDVGDTAAAPVRMNLVITEVPFGDSTVDAHLDTSSGTLDIEIGHLDPADLKVTVAYDIAKSMLVEGNPQAGMQAFLAGKVKVEGDMAKLLALTSGTVDPSAAEVASRIKEITA